MHEYGIRPESLVRALANHDEITYELVALRALPEHKFQYRGRSHIGPELADFVIGEMEETELGEAAPYHRRSGNGLCATFASYVAAALGIKDLSQASAHCAEIKKGHLLLAAYNALQPGVFALSGWDLVGALPLTADQLEQIPREFLGAPGKEDFRWLSRGAFDLLGTSPDIKTATGIPKAAFLYGALPEQSDPHSFASELKHMLEIRERHRLYAGKFCGIPCLSDNALFGTVSLLPGDTSPRRLTVTLLNFSRRHVRAEVELTLAPTWMPDAEAQIGNGKLADLLAPDHPIVANVANRCFQLDLGPWQYRLLEFLAA
jgi:trehalose synthase